MQIDNALYQELIIDHGTQPRNFCELSKPTHKAEGFNPLCGDRINIFLEIDNNIIKKVSFTGCGCAISQASASFMTEILSEKTLLEALNFSMIFKKSMIGSDSAIPDDLGKLKALEGVKAYPARVKCATLAWHTLESAIQNPVILIG